MLVISGDDARSTKLLPLLERHGYPVPAHPAAQKQLIAKILNESPKDRVLLVERPGWHADRFVLGPETYGQGGEPIMMGERLGQHLAQTGRCGRLSEWQADVGEPSVRSSYLIFALSTGFAAPLLRLTEIESGGFHFWGPSSRGKSTLLRCAASIYGKGESADAGYVRSWRVTCAAADEMSFGHCDLPLILDELKLLDPDPVTAARRACEIAYAIATGTAKGRSHRYDGRVPIDLKHYRILLMSAGEHSLEAQAAAGGSRRLRGEEARLIDIPVPPGETGIFDRLPDGEPSSETRHLAESLQQGCTKCYGVAGWRFIRELALELAEDQDGLRARLTHNIDRFLERAGVATSDGYEVRFARRFALVYAAALLAIDYEVVAWNEKLVLRCVRRVYRRALRQRSGAVETVEVAARRLIRRVRKIDDLVDISTAGASVDLDLAESARVLLATHSDGSRLLAVQPEFFRSITGRHVAAPAVARCLEEQGVLVGRPNGRRTRQIRIPGSDKRRDYYCLRLDRIHPPKDRRHRGKPD